MKNECPVCESRNILSFLEKSNVPVHQNYLAKTRRQALNVNKGNIKLCLCNYCGFIFNSEFDVKKLDYGCNYDNTQDISPTFESYIEKEIDYLMNNFHIKNKVVVEVGCGKGSFLNKLVKKSECTAIGFDPSYIGEETLQGGKLKFIKDFYSNKYSDLNVDFIIARHVIEHINNPIEILTNIKDALKDSPNAVVFIETPSVKWILENNIVYDFFYEHCSYFENVSITKALNICGFEVIKFMKEFNNQYMWIAAKYSPTIDIYNCNKEIEKLKELAVSYTKKICIKIDLIKEKLRLLNDKGKVAVWGAGAKGTTFVNLIDSNNQLIDSVIDINKNKQGCFILGTAHEIIDYRTIVYRNIKYVIVMNNNYYNEIRDLLNSHNIKIELISGEDFS